MLAIAFVLDDPDLEAGIREARERFNASLSPMAKAGAVKDDAEFAAQLARASLDRFRGSGLRVLSERVAKLPVADLAEVLALVDEKIDAAAPSKPIAEPPL